jgi:eukaryotic-like serine/threonine-protein kinase
MSDASARWRRVEDLCHAALERDASERSVFLAAECGDDEDLRRQVETLLAHEQSADRFLSPPVGAIAAQAVSGAAAVSWVGRRIGVYEIVSPLGAGGMGEVYRARDTLLGREVAIKVLSPEFTADRDRLSRFEREARVLASLNHPHIGAIYGVEAIEPSTTGGQVTRALVLELVEGETLGERLAKRKGRRGEGIPIAEALAIARQIAEALEAAHEKDIVHRDLKPANIKITPSGVVKVLDFGLAKPGAGWTGLTEQAGTDPAQSPTFTRTDDTHKGVLLGTAAYMSPEQARGEEVDKRADIWAFGCVLYEVLTGRMAFPGNTISDHIAAILEREPEWNALPAALPATVRRLLGRCLEKDPRRRLHDIADARIEIDDALVSPSAETIAVGGASSRRVVPMVLAALAGGAVIGLVAWATMRPSPRAPVLPSRFALALPPSETLNSYGAGRGLALSPDGRHLVYRSGGTMYGGSPLLIRAINELDARPLAGIVGALGPFVSPDSRWVGFFDSPPGIVEELLRKVPITGGPAIRLCAIQGMPLGASWGDDNTIVFATDDPGTGLWQVSASGGEPTVLTKPDSAQREKDHVFPSMLPGGGGVLFTITATGPSETSQVAVLDLKTGQRQTLIRGGSDAEYVEAGYLVYAAAGTLRAVRFDPVGLKVLSDPVPLVEQVMMTAAGAANYAVSRSGTLIYAPAESRPQRSLVWVDRKGREEPIKAPLRGYSTPRLSPDGTRVVVSINDQGNGDLWIWDLARERLSRLTVDPAIDRLPVWTPDGRRVIFASNPSGIHNLYVAVADGTGTVERLTTSAPCCGLLATSITPDGTRVVGYGAGRGTQQDIVVVPLANPAKEELLISTPFNEVWAEVSPDGRYLAYQSDELGRVEIYVRPFPDVGRGRWQVSRDGGTRAVWARNGRELFYMDGSTTLIAVPVQTSGSTFSAGTPAKVFDAKYVQHNPARHYDVSGDGQRFLMLKDSVTPAGLVVVEHWFEELKARVPSGS